MKDNKPTLNQARTRSFKVEAVRGEGETQSIEVSCSSNAAIRMGGFYEILDHSEKSVDLTRFLANAPLQLEHFGEQIGAVERAWLDGDKLRAAVRFSKSAKGQEILQDVLDGIRQNVSIRYFVTEYADAKAIDGIPCVRATKWTPSHLAIVGEPADIGVGFNRSLGNLTPEELQQLQALLGKVNATPADEPTGETKAVDDEPAEEVKTEDTPATENEPAEDTLVMEDEGREAEETPQDDEEKAADNEDSTEVNSTRAVSNAPILVRDRTMKTNSDKVVNPNIVLNDKEQREYSLARALRGLINNKRSGLEFEISETISGVRGGTEGFFMPTSIRAVSIGDSATGGAMTFTEGGEFIDYLRNKAVVAQLGATTLTLPGKLALPRANSDISAQWIAEDGSSATMNSQSFDQVVFSPLKMATLTGATREALTIANYDVENIIRQNIYNSFVTAFDRAAIQGTGTSNQPVGLLSGSGLVSGSNTGGLTYAGAIDLWAKVAGNNADVAQMSFLTTPYVKGKAMTTIASGSTADFIVNKEEKIGLYSVAHSNNVPTGHLIFGDWSSLCLAEFGAIEIIVDPFAAKGAGRVEIAATMLADVKVKTINSFAIQKGLT